MAEVFGSDAHVHRVVEQWSPLLLRLSYSYLGSTADAEDVVQEVFLALLRERVFQDEDHLKRWLVRVTLHRCEDLRRSAWRRRTVPLEERTAWAAFTPEETACLEEL